MIDINLKFCDIYNYPFKIKEQIKTVVSIIIGDLGEESVVSIAMLGSTCRGELSFRDNIKGELELFSDYELWVITKKRYSNKISKKIKRKIKEYSKKWAKNPLFGIDITINSLSTFLMKGRYERRISNYELKLNGIIIYGENILERLPEWGIDQLDIGNTNELILKRLWNQLKYTPLAIVDKKETKHERELMQYVLARNSLEILTVFLPNEGILLPSFRARVHRFIEKRGLHVYFPDKYDEFLNMCLKTKTNINFKACTLDYFKGFLEGYKSLLKYLGKRFSKNQSDDFFGRIYLKDGLFPKTRRFRNQLKSLFAGDNDTIIQNVINLFKDRRISIIKVLYYINECLYNILSNQREQTWENIETIKRLLNKIEKQSDKEKIDGNVIAQYKKLRYIIVNFMSTWLNRKMDCEGYLK